MSDIVDQLIFCGGCNVVSVVGIVGNSFSLLVMYPRKYSETKGLFYGYLSALAVADILFLIINIVYRFNKIATIRSFDDMISATSNALATTN